MKYGVYEALFREHNASDIQPKAYTPLIIIRNVLNLCLPGNRKNAKQVEKASFFILLYLCMEPIIGDLKKVNALFKLVSYLIMNNLTLISISVLRIRLL